jgi:hypothetical protein
MFGGGGKQEIKERMLRQRKRSVEALRAPCAAVSPATRSPRLTPCPLEGPPRPPPRFGGADVERSGVAVSVVCRMRGACHAPAPEIRLHWWFPPFRAAAAPPGGPATRRITLSAAARLEFAAPMTSSPAANGGTRGTEASQWPRAGTYVPN